MATLASRAVQRGATAVFGSQPRAAMGAGCAPLVVPGARSPRWWDQARKGGAQRSPMSSAAPSAALAGAKNPGQRARIKPQYQIPTWTAPPKRIIAAAVVERLPVITPDPEPWESAMWELQERKHTAMAKPLPDDWYRDDTGGLRKVEEEQGVEVEDATVGFAPRTTEADASNDTKSLERKLARRLFLVVKRKGEKLPGEGEWTFPQGDRAEGESMRDAAVRNLEAVVGKDAQMYFVGYSPMGYVDRGAGDARARVFCYKCQYISGALDYKAEDYLWLSSEELLTHLDPELAQVTRFASPFKRDLIVSKET